MGSEAGGVAPGSFLGRRGEGGSRAGILPTVHHGGHRAGRCFPRRLLPTPPSPAFHRRRRPGRGAGSWAPEPVGTEWALPVSRPPSHQAASPIRLPRLERLTPAADPGCSGRSKRAPHGTCPPGVTAPCSRMRTPRLAWVTGPRPAPSRVWALVPRPRSAPLSVWGQQGNVYTTSARLEVPGLHPRFTLPTQPWQVHPPEGHEPQPCSSCGRSYWGCLGGHSHIVPRGPPQEPSEGWPHALSLLLGDPP